MKRIAVYAIYDKKGIIDQSTLYFANDLKKNVDDILFVVNGVISDTSKKALKNYGSVLVRENKGYDIWAYKTGIYHIGWDKLKEYDELVLLNDTNFGPVYPLKESFDKFKNADIDFWGLINSVKTDNEPLIVTKYGYIPEHIQSHFTVFKNRIITSEDFKTYWDNLPQIKLYTEAIAKHEVIFTKYFSDLGYKWDTYVDAKELKKYSDNPIIMCPKLLIEKYRFPVFKRRCLFHDTDDFFRNTACEQITELIEYIKNNTNYNIDLIWNTLLRNYNQYDLFNNLNLTYILPYRHSSKIKEKLKLAIFYHIQYVEFIEQNIKYLNNIPNSFDVYITTNSFKNKHLIETKISKLKFNHFEIRVINNRGNFRSGFLIGIKEVVMKYDLACFAHDKRITNINPSATENEFVFKCLDNTLGSTDYINNVVNLFIDNPRIGILNPPAPNHYLFYTTVGKEHIENYKNTVNLAHKLNIDVPMSKDKPAIAPYDSIFWFRPKALHHEFDYNWSYTDFPQNETNEGQSVFNAMARIHPYAAQAAGYFPCQCMNNEFASIEYSNIRYYLRKFSTKLVKRKYGVTYEELFNGMLKDFIQADRFNNKILDVTVKVVRIPYRIIKKPVVFIKNSIKNKDDSKELDD